MADHPQNDVRPVETVQQVAERLRADLARTGSCRPQDLEFVFGDISTAVLVAVNPPCIINQASGA